jgi:hypothetical protein
VQCAHKRPKLDADVVEPSVGCTIYRTYPMVWDKELFFPSHEEDATVTRGVFESMAWFDKFGRMKVMKGGELLPVVTLLAVALGAKGHLPMKHVDIF